MPPVAVIALLAVIVLWGLTLTTTKITQTSPAGRQEIIRHEGVRYVAYHDSAGYWTIGIGHKVIPGDGLPRDSDGVPLPIDEAGIVRLFETDLANVEKAIARNVRVGLTQGQYDALADFIFQFGPGAFAGSTLLKYINGGNFPSAANEFKRWIYVTNPATGVKEQDSGLIARREDNYRTFVT